MEQPQPLSAGTAHPTVAAAAAAVDADTVLRQRPSVKTSTSSGTIQPASESVVGTVGSSGSPSPPLSNETIHPDEDKKQAQYASNAAAANSASAAASAPASSVGRTKDGHAFIVPHTPDMLSSIFDPRQPKTPLDFITIASLAFQLIVYFALPRGNLARTFFFLYFAFWRAAYDAGLGHLLKMQSERNWITKTVKQKGWFDQKRNPQSYKWVRSHLETKMEKDYNFEACPLDYNIWIFFRSIVDIILLNDVSCRRSIHIHRYAHHIHRHIHDYL